MVCKKTPCVYKEAMIGEEINLEMQHKGYRTHTSSLRLISNVNNKFHRFQKLRKSYGYLIVESFPSGGKVYINGKFMGVTPLSRIRLTTGRYRVKVVNRAGTKSKKAIIRIHPKRTEKRSFVFNM